MPVPPVSVYSAVDDRNMSRAALAYLLNAGTTQLTEVRDSPYDFWVRQTPEKARVVVKGKEKGMSSSPPPYGASV